MAFTLSLLGVVLYFTGLCTRRHGYQNEHPSYPTPYFRHENAPYTRDGPHRHTTGSLDERYLDDPFSRFSSPGGFINPARLTNLHFRNRSNEPDMSYDVESTVGSMRMPEPEPYNHSPTYSQPSSAGTPRGAMLQIPSLPPSVHSDEFSILHPPNTVLSPVAVTELRYGSPVDGPFQRE